MTTPVRVGFVLDGRNPTAWQAQWIDRIAAEPGIDVVLLVANMLAPAPRSEPLTLSWLRRLDARLHRGDASRFTKVAYAGPPGSTWHSVLPARGPDGRLRLDDDDLEVIAAARLDVLIRLDGESLAIAGLWSLAIAGNLDHGRAWSAINELASGSDSVEAELRIDRSGEPAIVAARSRIQTHEYSPQRTRAMTIGSAPGLVLVALRRLRDRGMAGVLESAERPSRDVPPRAGIIAAPLRYVTRVAAKVVSWPFFDIYNWTLAIAPRNPARSVIDDLRSAAFRRLPQPADEFWADPMLFERNGETWLFFEIFLYNTGLGVLAASRIAEDGTIGTPAIILQQQDVHLSYPFVFTHGEDVYLIPESADRGSVDLYRCTQFPDRWELDCTLLPGVRGVDSTLVIEDGRFWLFTGTTFGVGTGETDLHLYVADQLRGPYRPHPANPIVRDAGRARPGGRLLRTAEGLVRVSQDCRGRYGRALSFDLIERMTLEDYRERPLTRVGPEDTTWARGTLGIHTVDATSRWIVADACISQFRGARWMKRLSARARAEATAGDRPSRA